MRIYTEIVWSWDDEKGELVRESSKSYDYVGPLTLAVGRNVKNYSFFVGASFCENQRSSDPAFESRGPGGHFASRNSRIGRGIAEISIGESLCYSAQSKVPLQFLQTPSLKNYQFFTLRSHRPDPLPIFKTGLTYFRTYQKKQSYMKNRINCMKSSKFLKIGTLFTI